MADLPIESTQSGLPEHKRHSPGERPDATSTPSPRTLQPTETTPAEERGERLDTGKTIARGGKTTGDVPGATPQDGHEPPSAAPPSPQPGP